MEFSNARTCFLLSNSSDHFQLQQCKVFRLEARMGALSDARQSIIASLLGSPQLTLEHTDGLGGRLDYSLADRLLMILEYFFGPDSSLKDEGVVLRLAAFLFGVAPQFKIGQQLLAVEVGVPMP